MAHQFKKHFTLEEARALLPQIRLWLQELAKLRHEIGEYDEDLSHSLSEGRDLGGRSVNESIKAFARIKWLVNEFSRREIQIKDLDRGLIDFPAIIKGREVFLCWEQEDDDIEFWHDLDAGYAGRERL